LLLSAMQNSSRRSWLMSKFTATSASWGRKV
jgi:hypothetical protein